MSIETALAALSTPAPSPEPVAPSTQSQALKPNEVAAAVTESETKTKTSEASPAETSKDGVVEAAKAAEATKPKEEPASAKFTALAKKEKAIVERDQKIKAHEKSVAEREARIAEREARIAKSEAKWETDVFEAIKERTGMDYNALTIAYLEGNHAAPKETDPVKLATKTIEDFKREQQEERAKAQEESKKAQEAAAQKQKEEVAAAWDAYKTEINEYVDANKDDYELISLYGQQALVADTVNEFYQQNKRVLSVKEASDIVEKYLEDEAKKALGSKKLGGLKSEPKKETAPEPKASNSPKTLNNNMQPTSASVLPAQSENDRMRRAMAALEGKR